MNLETYPKLQGFFAKAPNLLRKWAQELCLALGIAALASDFYHYYESAFFNVHDGLQKEGLVPGVIYFHVAVIALGAVSWPRREGRRYAIAGIACAAAGIIVLLIWDYTLAHAFF